MKTTRKNQFAKAILEKHLQLFPSTSRLEVTQSGKVHTGFGKLAEFTCETDACSVLEAAGFAATGNRIGSFVEWARNPAQPFSATRLSLRGANAGRN